MIDLVYPNCAGLDVHKKFVVVCRLTVDSGGRTHKELRQFSTMTPDLEALSAWLKAGNGSHVAMESTGVYWQPVYNILAETFEVFLVNAQTIKRLPGRKTDMKDAEWIATLMQHGLLPRSYVPEREQRVLRDLVRYRQTLTDERARVANRLQKVLEGANIKLAAVATNIQGVSAQAILRALINGDDDPAALADLAKGVVRQKRELLEQALVGRVREHEQFMLKMLLKRLTALNDELAEVEARIETLLEAMPPFAEAARLVDTIPGVSRHLAILIVAEVGVDMTRFPSDRHITAWAGVAPGNNETGGKRGQAATRKGNKYLRRGLVLAAHVAARSKPNFLRAHYYRLAQRRGKGRAAMAVARSILRIVYHMLSRHEPYRELGADYYDLLDRERAAKHLIKRLETLGYAVTVTQPAA